MKKKFILICCLMLFSFACFALGAERALKKNPEFVGIGEKWGEKLGNHYIVNLTGNRILEFAEIDSRNGGGKYACLSRIDEFELRGFVKYPKDSCTEEHWKDCYSSYARLQDLSYAIGIKIETMVDVINHYDEILTFIKMIANEQYSSDDYIYHVDSENRKATIWVDKIHGYYNGLWHGVKEGELPFNGEDWGESLCVRCYGENWREKLNADLPKIRKSLGLEN